MCSECQVFTVRVNVLTVKLLQVKLLAVDRIQPQSNEFAMGVENEATGVSKFNDSLL